MDIKTLTMSQDQKKERIDNIYKKHMKGVEGKFLSAYDKFSIEGKFLSTYDKVLIEC